MIIHAIIKYEPSKKVIPYTEKTRSKFHGKLGSESHKKFIMDRACEQCKLAIGDRVIYKKKEWAFNGMYDSQHIDWIEWNGLAPLNVELVSTTEPREYEFVNMGQIKRKR